MTKKNPLILFLIGPRASGKSTVGRILAERLGLPFHDTDDMVMDEAGCSIAEIVRLEGWESFRTRESRALALAVARAAESRGRPDDAARSGDAGNAGPSGDAGTPDSSAAAKPGLSESALSRRGASGVRAGAVVSTGGGMVLARENRERMRASGTVFYLAAPLDCLYARLERQFDAGRRPSLTGESPLAELARVLEEREPLYRETAHHIIDATVPRAAMARTIVRLLAEQREEIL